MTNKQLLERIERLENALSIADKPYHDSECGCCGKVYIGGYYDSCRCSQCCSTCRYDKENRQWIKGRMCPKNKKEYLNANQV